MGDTQSRIMNREFSRVQGLVSHSVTCITPVFLSVLFSRESALVTKNKTKKQSPKKRRGSTAVTSVADSCWFQKMVFVMNDEHDPGDRAQLSSVADQGNINTCRICISSETRV